MINDLDIVQWEYLLSPEFELINSAGKPLTGGWIEVYLHGTRDKYYCASDFSGTLHPFQIPLDSIGANVVLADPNNAYDVYVYNKFGSLIMSRYNVKCHGGGSGSSTYVGDKLYYGQFKATDVSTQAGLTRVTGNIDVDNGKLELKQGMSYHITLRGDFVVNDVSNVDTVLSYIEYSAVKPINVNVDYTKDGSQYFEISYDIYRLAEDMDYPVSFMQSNGLVKNLTVEVHSLSNLATSSTGGSEYESGWGIVIQNNVISVDPSIFNDYATHEEVIAAVSGITGVGPGEVYTAGDYISIEDNTISVTGIDPDEYATHDEVISAVTSISLDEYATHEEVYNSSVTAINLVTGMIPEEQVQSDWDQEDENEPDYIKNKPHIPSIELDSGDQVTAIDGHTIAGTGGSEYNEGFGIDISNGEISIDTNIVALASAIPQVQVQSDWDQADDTQVDFIKNKPDLSVYATHDELAGVTGILQQEIDNIDLSDYSTHTEVYNATVTAVQVATGAIPEMPEEEEVEFEAIDLNDYALASAIPEVDSFATRNEVTAVSSVLHEEINDVAESIIHYQAGEGIDITNDTISLSDPISLEAGSGINFTTAGDTITINADPVDLSDYVTHEELIESVSAVTGMGEYGQFYCAACTGTAELGKVKGTLSVTNDGKVSLKKGCSYHVTVRGGVEVDPTDNTYGAFGLTEFITGNSINSNIDRTIEDTQYFEISYDLYNISVDTDYEFAFTNVGGAVKALYVEIHEIGHVGSGSGGVVTGTAEYDAGWGINIVNNVISVDPTVIPEQVQSDWAETASALPSFIKNKPVEYDLVAGQNISIAVTGTNVVISSTGGSGGATYTEGFGIDIANNEISIDPGVVALASAVNPDNMLTYDVSTWDDFRTMLDSGTNGVFVKDHSGYNIDSNIYDIGVLTYYDDSSAKFIRIMDGYPGMVNRARLYTLTSGSAWSRSYIKLAPMVEGGFGIKWTYYMATDTETLSVDTDVVALASAVPVIELNGDSQVTAIDGHALAGGGSGGTSYTAGTGIDITNDVISVDNTVAMKTDIPEDEEVEFEDIDLSVYALASAVPAVQLDSNNQVTAIDGHTLAGTGGTTYTAGTGIDITNDVISVDNTVAMKTDIPTYTAASGVKLVNNVISLDEPVQLVAGDNVSISVSGVSAVISAQGGGGGSTYTEGLGIDISNDEISIDPSVVALVSAIPADKVIKVDYGTYGNTFTANEFKNWWQSGKFVYLYVPEGAYLPGNVPHGLMDYGPMYLPMTKVGSWEEKARFSGIVDNTEWNDRYIVTLEYNGYANPPSIPYWTGTYTKVVTESDIQTDYIPYAASGVYLPNSKFEIGSDGTAYKIDSPESYTLMTTWEGSYELQILDDIVAGVYEIRVAGNTASYIKASGWGFPTELRNGIPLVNGCARVTFPDNIGIDYHYTTIASYDSDNNQCYDTMQAYRVTPAVKSEYALKSDIPSTVNFATKSELNSVEAEVEAVSGLITPELPVVAGTGIGITETSAEITIAVTGNYVSDSDLQSAIQTVEAEIPVVTGYATKATTLAGYGITDAYTKSEVNTRLNGKQGTLTGITDVQVVNSLPISPVSTVLYLIPEV